MNLKPDVLTAMWVVAVALVGIWGWRTVGGLAAANPTTASLGKGMLSISG